MADIFLSYSQSDAARAKQIADALSAKGWSVWWDVSLVAGDRYRSKIAEELRAARCVVVLWSAASIESDWVIDEAEEGKKRNILAQALIEDVLPPHGFRQLHAPRLIDWDGEDSGEFARLSRGISGLVGQRSAASGHPSHDPTDPSLWRWPSLSSLSMLSIRDQWLELEQCFRMLRIPQLVAKRSFLPPVGEKAWQVSDSALPQGSMGFQALAKLAGELLAKSHTPEERKGTLAVLANDPVDRWLDFLARWREGVVLSITDLAEASAEACVYCAEKERDR